MMKLPYSTEVNELNRMLIAVSTLALENGACASDSAVVLCSSFVLGGRPVDHRRTLRLCSAAGFVSLAKGEVALTELGIEFLKLNASHVYEFTDEQKRFFVKRLILSGPWSSQTRDLLLNFTPNHSRLTYVFDEAENALPVRCAPAAVLCSSIGLLIEEDNVLSVAPEYVADVVRLLADRHGTTQDDLGRVLEESRRLADQAEDQVVDYERERLEALGCKAEASLVRRISQLDVGAGYDIESFDGDKTALQHDRFIEVKASQYSQLRFFWTANERATAERLGSKYWIYFVSNVGNRNADYVPIMIRDPANRLWQIPKLRIEVAVHLVTQTDEPVLTPVAYGNIRGFLL